MNGDDVLAMLEGFFIRDLLDPDQGRDLKPDTPLRELGVLNSLGMAKLVAFIRGEIGVGIPSKELTSGNFKTLNDITGLVLSVRDTDGEVR